MDTERASIDTDSSDEAPAAPVVIMSMEITREEFHATQGFTWIDIHGSSPGGKKGYRKFLKDLAEEHVLHPQVVKDCMAPNHLPKLETATWKTKKSTQIMTRYFDETAGKTEDRIQDLTNKFVIFITDNSVITIHRQDLPKIREMRKQWEDPREDDIPFKEFSKLQLVCWFVERVLETYRQGCERDMQLLDKYEASLFTDSRKNLLAKLYHIKRRASVFQRMLKLSEKVTKTLHNNQKEGTWEHNLTRRLLELADAVSFETFDLHEIANNLMNLYVTLQSHKTNELMKVLTIFSAFFIPLTFTAGVYGMNFEHMPELSYVWAYPTWIALQVVIVIGIYIGFYMKGMLPSPLDWSPAFRKRRRMIQESNWRALLHRGRRQNAQANSMNTVAASTSEIPTVPEESKEPGLLEETKEQKDPPQ